MTTNGPTKTSELSAVSSVSNQAQLIAIVTVAGSIQTVRIPVTVLQNNNVGPLDNLSDVSIDGTPTDNMGLVYSSAKSQWVAASVGDMRIANNLSEVDASAARANLDVLSSTSINLFYLSINAVTNTQIQTLANVSISAPTDTQVLAYNSANSEWVNRQLTTNDISGIGAYITSASVLTALTPYITSASIETRLTTFITSASLLTALTPYITSASITTVLGSYITSTSLLTALGPYITSASASTLAAAIVAPYLTSASASTQYSSIAHNHVLGSLSNVSVSTSPPDMYSLTWSSAAGQWVAAPGGASGVATLASAADVSISSAGDGQLLVFRTSDSKWHNETFDFVTSASVVNFITSASASALAQTLINATSIDNIKDVSISSATDAQVLAYASVSGKWINRQLSVGDISGIGAYITSASIATALSPYLTSASASTQYASVNVISNTSLDNIKDVSITSPTDAQVLAYSSSQGQWVNRQLATGDISGIGAYLTSASASTQYASAGIITNTSLDNIKDVSISSATDLHVLVYSSAQGQWLNKRLDSTYISDIGSYITSASVATALSPYITSASVLTALGPYITSASAVTAFGGKITTIASATDVTISAATNGNILIYRTADSKWHSETVDYPTSASVSTMITTALGSYITSASVVTLTANYITSASASSMASSQVRVVPTLICAAMSISAANYGEILLISNSVLTTIELTTVAGSALPLGSQIPIVWYGSAQPFVHAGTGVTLRVPTNASAACRVQYSTIILVNVSANEWLLTGDLA